MRLALNRARTKPLDDALSSDRPQLPAHQWHRETDICTGSYDKPAQGAADAGKRDRCNAVRLWRRLDSRATLGRALREH